MYDESLVKTMLLTSAIPLAMWKFVSLIKPNISICNFEGVARVFAMSTRETVFVLLNM